MFLIKFSRIFRSIRQVAQVLQNTIRKNIVFCVFMAFAGGIVINEQILPNVWSGLFGALACLGIACGIFNRRGFVFFILAAVICAGMLYCRAACFLPTNHILYVSKGIDRKASTFIGTVASDVKQVQALGRYQAFEFLLDHVVDQEGRGRRTEGKVQARVFHDIEASPGDTLEIQGTLHRPFEFKGDGKFSYRDYLRNRQIYFMLTSGRKGFARHVERKEEQHALIRFREKLKQHVDRHFPEFEGGILKAVLLGDRTHIDREVREVFSKTGTAHILAISGLHMGMLLLIFLFVLGFLPIGLKCRYIIAMMLLILYLPIAGARVSVLRSGIMSVIFLYSFVAERRPCSLNALGLSGLIILLMNPLELYAVGFQLSFSAVLSLILFYDSVVRVFQRIFPNIWEILRQSLAASFSAWLGIAGWVMYYFQIFSPIGLFANIAVIALMSVLITTGMIFFVAAVLGVQWLAAVTAMNAVILTRALVYGVVLLEQVPFGYFSDISVNSTQCALYYGVLVGGFFIIKMIKSSKNTQFS